MARLYITELERLGFTLVDGQVMAAPELPGVNEQGLTIDGSGAVSAPWDKRTRYVMINTDVPCSLAWSNSGDPAPVADPLYQRMGTNETRFISVKPGGQLAVIANT